MDGAAVVGARLKFGQALIELVAREPVSIRIFLSVQDQDAWHHLDAVFLDQILRAGRRWSR